MKKPTCTLSRYYTLRDALTLLHIAAVAFVAWGDLIVVAIVISVRRKPSRARP